MEGDFIKINKALLPLSWIYGLGVKARNVMFDIGMLKSRSFKEPIISMGNITVGGTGKTPHVAYLVELLKGKVGVAVLSRGYKRKSKGFQLATDSSTAREIGDEPLQMKRKYPEAIVAVDKDRCRGIERLTSGELGEKTDVILLDDAFQHRYVKPGINILLVDYHRLIIYDRLLPAGRMREPLSGKNRADIVIVTKCPKELKPMEFRVLTKAMNLYPYQRLYFTTLDYSEPRPIFDAPRISLEQLTKETNILLLTGIASPRQMMEDLQAHCANITPLTFADHHNFRQRDIDRINTAFAALPSPRIIITTEKDEVRLIAADGLSEEVRKSIYALPVSISFMLDQQESFDQTILSYVQKNSKNSILAKDNREKKADAKQPEKEKTTTTISFK